jgi:hypothetical protein
MYAARETEVRLHGITAAQIMLDTRVELITFRNSQRRIESTRKIRVQHTKLAHQTRVAAQLLRKPKMFGNECTTLIGAHQLAG